MPWSNILVNALSFFIFFCLIFFIVRIVKRKTFPRPLATLFLISVVAFCFLVISPAPGEQLFRNTTFSTLEQAGEKAFPGSSLVIVQGETSAMICAENTNELVAVVQVANGYKLHPSGVALVATVHSESNEVGYGDTYLFHIYSIADDYYVRLSGMWQLDSLLKSETELKYTLSPSATVMISDNRNSEFEFSRLAYDASPRSFTAVAYVEGYGENYTATIEEQDGEGRVVLTTMMLEQ